MRLVSRTAGVAALYVIACVGPGYSSPHAPVTIHLNFSHLGAKRKPLHGVNKGPLAAGGLVDVTDALRILRPPFIRLHDCHWPNPDVVDVHAVFPDPNADPARPESYDFRLTDEYIAAARATGAQIIYRLGESIEHTSVKRFVNPPADPEKWARVAEGIVRHYNAGWAGGFEYGIRYWEIWNEPDNRPASWTGTDAQYFALYAATARRIRAAFPEVKVGGPAVSNTGRLQGGRLEPSPFVSEFLNLCTREKIPLDFFSWHCYSSRLGEIPERAREVRRVLDERGFTRTESHLDEWNYLPDNDWAGLSRTAAPLVRKKFYDRMAGSEGAAFVTATLLRLQDAPIDVCCLFHGETGGFGLFDENGVHNDVWHALRAYRELADGGASVGVTGENTEGFTTAATLSGDRKSATALVARTATGAGPVRLTVAGFDVESFDVALVEQAHPGDLAVRRGVPEAGGIVFELEGPGVALVRIKRSKPIRGSSGGSP